MILKIKGKVKFSSFKMGIQTYFVTDVYKRQVV